MILISEIEKKWETTEQPKVTDRQAITGNTN